MTLATGPAALTASRLALLAEALEPGATIKRERALHGGLDAAMDLLALTPASGPRRCIVLRRYLAATSRRDPELPARAWRTLLLLQQLRLSAPRPIWFDGDGCLLGRPALAMSWIDGAPVLEAGDTKDWTCELARALARLHDASLTAVDSGFLPAPGEAARRLMTRAARRLPRHPDARAVVEALNKSDAPYSGAPVLAHGDYWAGNTVWSGGRIAAIVDWDSAAIDDAGLDVGYCRMDLAMLAGPEVPDRFLHAYERARRLRVQRLWFWDLLGALRAMPDPARWLPGYHGLGRTDLTADDMRVRLRGFIADAVGRASAGVS